jgi:hypothetical protein
MDTEKRWAGTLQKGTKDAMRQTFLLPEAIQPAALSVTGIIL